MAGKKTLPRYNGEYLLLYKKVLNEDVKPNRLESYRNIRDSIASMWYLIETKVPITFFDKDGTDYAIIPAKREYSRRYRMLKQKALYFRRAIIRALGN